MTQDAVPLSISLFQFAAALLVQGDKISGPLTKFHFLRTQERTTLYPSAEALVPFVVL